MRLIWIGWMTLMFALPASGGTIVVSAAISLKESLLDIRKVYESDSKEKVVFNFDASGKLAAQIAQGAPVDVFISADDEQMDKLAKDGRMIANTRRVVVNNTLVLIAPANQTESPKNFADLATDHGKKIAIGEPRTVPAGHYAMQTFKALKLDQSLADRLVYGESVRQVLTYVEQAQVYAGVVYGTDAKQAGDKVKIIATADPSTHDVIEYPAALITGTSHRDDAQKFLDFLSTKTAKSIFIARGFSIPRAKSADQNSSATTRPNR